MKYRHQLCIAAGAFMSLSMSASAAMSFSDRADTLSVKKDSCAATADSSCCMPKQDEKKAKETEYDKLIKKGGSCRTGLFTVRHIEKDWYFEVPETLLGKLLLTVTRFTSVPQGFSMYGGEEVQRNAVYFELYNEKTMFLRSYAQNIDVPEKSKMEALMRTATTAPIVHKFDVVGRNPENKSILVNVTKLFETDTKIGGLIQADRTQVKLGALQGDRTLIDTIRTYPINVEVSTIRTYAASGGSTLAERTGFLTLGLNTSIVALPDEPMRPRFADERVGYFQDKVVEYSDDDATHDKAIISRYRLVPKDKKAYRAGKLVEPVKPIVYYIDPATPKKWVPYLKQGINDWNVAFEAAGFRNAIIAKEWQDNDTTMSVDDARFSVLRYLPSTSENAYGPRIVDPRSGEIIESHICWFHNVQRLVKKWYITQCGPLDKRAQTMDLPDDLMGELIRFVSSHEVGHTLGLRHNMIASSATPVEKLRDKAWVEANGHTASIMDYARFNYVAQPEDNIGTKGLFPRINDYDKWAIKWGYQYRDEFKDANEEAAALRKEVTAMLRNNVRLRYCGDEGKGSDPRSQAEDLGDNSMKATAYGIKNLQRVMTNIEKWSYQEDDVYEDLSTLHRTVRAQFVRYTGHVQKNIGGVYSNNTPGLPARQIVPRPIQREAVEWMGRYVFEPALWLYPQSVVDKLGIKAHDELVELRMSTISYLLAPGMMVNIYNNSFVASEPYQLTEYLNDVFAAAWKPLTDNDERKNMYRRQLERTYMEFINTALNPTEKQQNVQTTNMHRTDVAAYLLQHLTVIEEYCNKQISSHKEGDINQTHYNDILRRIKNTRKEYLGEK